jgi:hypothetical protein
VWLRNQQLGQMFALLVRRRPGVVPIEVVKQVGVTYALLSDLGSIVCAGVQTITRSFAQMFVHACVWAHISGRCCNRAEVYFCAWLGPCDAARCGCGCGCGLDWKYA